MKASLAKKSLGIKPYIHPIPAFLIGCYTPEGKPNMMLAACAGICSIVEPVCVTVSVHTARFSHECIIKNEAFTLNVPGASIAAEADFAALSSGKDVDKFAATGLTPVMSTLVNAPYIAECAINVECELYQTNVVGSFTQMIGRVVDLKVSTNCLTDDGAHPDVTKYLPLIVDCGIRVYRVPGEKIGDVTALGAKFQKK